MVEVTVTARAWVRVSGIDEGHNILHRLGIRLFPFTTITNALVCGLALPGPDGRLDAGGVLSLDILLEDEVEAVAEPDDADGQHLWGESILGGG